MAAPLTALGLPSMTVKSAFSRGWREAGLLGLLLLQVVKLLAQGVDLRLRVRLRLRGQDLRLGRLGRLDGGRLDRRARRVIVQALDLSLQDAHRLAYRAGGIRQLARPEDEYGHYHQDYDVPAFKQAVHASCVLDCRGESRA